MRLTASQSPPITIAATLTQLCPPATTSLQSPAAAAAFTYLYLINTSPTLGRFNTQACVSAASRDIRLTAPNPRTSPPNVASMAKQHASKSLSITADVFGSSGRTASIADTSARVAARGLGGVQDRKVDSRRCRRVRMSMSEWPHEHVAMTGQRCCDCRQQQGAHSQKHDDSNAGSGWSTSTSHSNIAAESEGLSRSSSAPSTPLPHAGQTTPQDAASRSRDMQRVQSQVKP